MALIWSRNKIWGGTFTTDVDVADGTNNASVVPASNFLGLVQGSETDPRNRSKWFSSVIGQLLRAVLHKEEDRATGSNIGVSGTGIEPTVVPIVFVVPEQLPEVDKTTNDFLTPAKSDANGVLAVDNDLFVVTPVVTDRKNKRFVVSFSSVGVTFFKARTWLQSELVALINTTIYGSTETTGLIPVGTIWDYCGLDDPDGFINLCLTGSVRSISKASGAGTLKNDNYQNLFIKLYLSYADIRCPVSGGRSGADATAALNDFVSGKAISLPDYRGRVGGYYKLGDDNFGEVGKPIGTDLIEAAHLPENSPWGATSSSVLISVASKPMREATDTGDTEDSVVDDITFNSGSPTITMTTNVSADRKHFQPTIIQTAIIKY